MIKSGKEYKSISDLEELITCNDPIDLRPGDVLLDQDDYNEMSKCFEIVAKYKNSDWYSQTDVSTLQQDIIILQSTTTFLTAKTAVLISYAQGIEDQLKVARSKIRVNAKSLKKDFENQGETVRVTADDIKDLSYAKTEDLFNKLEQYRQAGDFVRYVHFSLKEQVKYLESALQRMHYRGE